MTINSTITHGVKGLFATGLLATLVACGGGGGGSSSKDDNAQGSEPVVARGVITQLGSIWVTGCRYVAAPGGTYKSDDGEPILFDDYEVGQAVSIKGTRSDDGVSCVADEVEYEAEIEGAANANGQILDITIVQTPNTNNIAPGSPNPLSNGTRYEISGIWINDKTLEATFIKVDDDLVSGIDEIKGFVESVDLGSGSFVVRGITFNGYGGSPVLAPNDYVEVHFNNCSGDPLNCDLTGDGVQLEDDFFDQAEGLEVEVEGAVDKTPSDCPPAADIRVDGVCVDTSSAQWMDGLIDFDSLVRGSRVEAEGHMVDAMPEDYMQADKVKGRGNRVRIESIATNPGAGTFNLIDNKVTVETMSGVTEFEPPLSNIADAIAADSVEVRGVRTGPNSVLALRIKDDGGLSSGDRHELRAEVDSVTVVENDDSLDDRLTVMGVVSRADLDTDLEIGDLVIADSDANPPMPATPQAIEGFLLTIDADNDPANGPRDIVEIGIVISGGAPYLADEWEVEEEDD